MKTTYLLAKLWLVLSNSFMNGPVHISVLWNRYSRRGRLDIPFSFTFFFLYIAACMVVYCLLRSTAGKQGFSSVCKTCMALYTGCAAVSMQTKPRRCIAIQMSRAESCSDKQVPEHWLEAQILCVSIAYECRSCAPDSIYAWKCQLLVVKHG